MSTCVTVSPSCSTVEIDDGSEIQIVEVNKCVTETVNKIAASITIPDSVDCLSIYASDGETLLFKMCKNGNFYLTGRVLKI